MADTLGQMGERSGSFGGSWVCLAVGLSAVACGHGAVSSKSDAAGAGGGSNGSAGKTGAGGSGAGGSGAGSSGAQGGSTSQGGSSSGGSTSSGGSNGGGPLGGAGVSEQVCGTDPTYCFDVVHQQWPGTGNAGVDGVAFDAAGNVLVAASTLGGLERLDPLGAADFLIKWTPTLQFSSAGQQLGISRALALDSSDNAFRIGVYNLGANKGTAGLDLWVTKTASDGTELWRKPIGSTLYDEARGMATDGTGSCYIGGFTEGQFADDPNAGGADALVVKLAPNGDQLWAHQFGSSDFDTVTDVCVDAEGNAYVTGDVAGTFASPGQGESDLFVAKFSSEGEQVWAKQIGSAARDAGTGIACGADFVYVVGITLGRLDDPQAATPAAADIVLLKYDLAGNQVWLKQWLTGKLEGYSKIALGQNGNPTVAGVSETDLDGLPANGPGGETDLFLGEWSTNGEPLWTYQWGSDSWDSAMGIAISPTGRIAVGAMTQGPLPQFASLSSGGAVLSVFTPK